MIPKFLIIWIAMLAITLAGALGFLHLKAEIFATDAWVYSLHLQLKDQGYVQPNVIFDDEKDKETTL